MAIEKIPLPSFPATFGIYLNSSLYTMRTYYNDSDEGGWVLDIGDANGAPLVCGIALVTNTDLLEQYEYLGIGGKLYVATPGDLLAPPTVDSLGVTSFLYFEAT
jgi:hypothetical protein